MRGWWLADDGRLYHDTLVKRVTEMMDRRRKESDRKALARSRAAAPAPPPYIGVPDLSHGTDAGRHPESDTDNRQPITNSQSQKHEKASPSLPQPAAGSNGPPACPHGEIIEAFHAALPVARRVVDWTPARAAALKARWREDEKRQNIGWWQRFFAYIAKAPFLTGRVEIAGRKPFELSLDWLVKAENFAKVREGAYHEHQQEPVTQ